MGRHSQRERQLIAIPPNLELLPGSPPRFDSKSRAEHDWTCPRFLLAALVELCAWNEPKATLPDRREQPWDNADRRRVALEMLRQSFPTVELTTIQTEKFRAYLHSLYTLCV